MEKLHPALFRATSICLITMTYTDHDIIRYLFLLAVAARLLIGTIKYVKANGNTMQTTLNNLR